MPSISSAPPHQGIQPLAAHNPGSLARSEKGNGGWSSMSSINPLEGSGSFSVAKTPLAPLSCVKRANTGKMNLAMCTENLGCETGAFCSLGNESFPKYAGPQPEESDTPSSLGNESFPKYAGPQPEESDTPARGVAAGSGSKRRSSASEFPPPLTTLRSGEGCLRLVRKREDGMVKLVPFKPSVLAAKRVDGRLLLRLLPTTAKEVEEGREAEEVGEEEAKEDGEEEEGYLGVVGMEMNGMSFSGEEETVKYRWASRCKEEEAGGPGRAVGRSTAVLNCWVTTS